MVAQERINVREQWEEKTTVSYISFQYTSFEKTKKYICLLKVADASFKCSFQETATCT